MDTFNAFRIFDEDGRIGGRLVRVTLDELSPVMWSSKQPIRA